MKTRLIHFALAVMSHICEGEHRPSSAEAKSIAEEGFVFGLPLVYIAMQADAQSNVAKPEPGRHRSISSTPRISQRRE
jgi:hypothetical protein